MKITIAIALLIGYQASAQSATDSLTLSLARSSQRPMVGDDQEMPVVDLPEFTDLQKAAYDMRVMGH